MRDGTVLRTDVFRPAEQERTLPVILMRMPYGKSQAQTQVYGHPITYAQTGYIVAVQDTRGRGRSDGDFYPFLNEMDDGYDTVEWAAQLEGSSGRVGMYGFSYAGATQLFAAVTAPPHLTCIAPATTGGNCYEGWIYRGGALSLAFAVSWGLKLSFQDALKKGDMKRARALKEAQGSPGRYFDHLPPSSISLLNEDDCPYFQDWLSHPTYDSYWQRWSIESLYDRVQVPTLHIGGWYDFFKDGTISNFIGIRNAGNVHPDRNHLLMGPWYHMPWPSILNGHDFGPDAKNDIDRIQLRWFDRWLKDIVIQEPTENDPSEVRVFTMGRNRWESYSDWPPRDASEMIMYLNGHGPANSLDGAGTLTNEAPVDETQDIFTYDPWSPVQSVGGHSCCVPGLTPMGPKDQRPVESHPQVLVYDSAALSEEVVVAGPVTARLWVATSAVDTDFVAKLVDVWPDGQAINICEGILRMSYRDGYERPSLLEPWRVYEVEVDLGHTCNVFLPAHRIRLEVTSSCYPHWDRNLNTGVHGEIEEDADVQLATQIVFRGPDRPSLLMLPVREVDT